MLQIKNGAIKATFNIKRQEAAMPVATGRCQQGRRAVCRRGRTVWGEERGEDRRQISDRQ